MYKPKELYKHPNELAQHYKRFNVEKRLLLTGHSHQAWPDCAFDGQIKAIEDAAIYVDEKWNEAFNKAEKVKSGYARLIDDYPENIALGQNTHQLVVRFLSGLPLREKPRIITTVGEFHSIRRQLERLEEEGIEIVRVQTKPVTDVIGKIIEHVNDRTAAVMVSSVLFQSGLIIPGLHELQPVCEKYGAELLIDAYHSVNVVPFSVKELKLVNSFVVGGGYKYCQLGEGSCFMRVPPDCSMRPVVTGWFAEFSQLTEGKEDNKVFYGKSADRFAGSTYDPVSHYRASEVFDFFERKEMTPEFLREINTHQTSLLAGEFDELDLDQSIISRNRSLRPDLRGGFLVLETNRAEEICMLLRKNGVLTDFRSDSLRFGPAPYLSDKQLISSMEILGRVVKFLPQKVIF